MKKMFFLISLSLAFCGIMNATRVVQTVTLKNGSVMYGYVKQAVNGIITFNSDTAYIIIDKDANGRVESRARIPFQDLKNHWVNWAEKNNAFQGIGDNRYFVLSSISFVKDLHLDSTLYAQKKYFLRDLRQKSFSGVRVLQEGEIIKYLEFAPNCYTFSWDEVSEISIPKRPKEALSGINCTYTTRTSDKDYDGQPAGETKTTLSLYNEEGVIQTLDFNQVVRRKYYRLNNNQPIFEQSELLDVVYKKNEHAPVKGIIIEENYVSAKNEENYIKILSEGGEESTIWMSDFAFNAKEENPHYHPLFDVILQDGDVLINRMPVHSVTFSVSDNNTIVLDSLGSALVLTGNKSGKTEVILELKGTIADAQKFQLVEVTETPSKKKNKTPVYSFTFRDLVERVTPYDDDIVTTVNGTTRVKYQVGGLGVYVLYNGNAKRAIPFLIK